MARIYLAGRVAIEGDGGVVDEPRLPGVQGRVVLAVLAMHRGPVARAELADVVWNGEPPAAWDAAVSAIVSKLRTAANAAGVDGRALFAAGPGTVELRRTGPVWVDVEEALRRVDAAEGAARRGDWREAWTHAAVASSISGRTLLTGVDSPWVDDRRRQQHDVQLRAFAALADAFLGLGDPGQAVLAAERLVAADPLRETSHQRLMRALLAGGDRARALQAYARCVDVLRDELGVPPSPSTRRAYEQALAQ